ncbi:MAG: phytanoyl-CoA dioxygenase family protein [Planctomycetes bacterium]|nr:phytanoyl-CoA dioxygenase family protein [Planctomycetota bacterium]
MDDRLLDASQMAAFVADGFLRFDALVPEELNLAVLDEIRRKALDGVHFNQGGHDIGSFFPRAPTYQRVLGLPRVRAIIASLVGPDPEIDHSALHVVGPRTPHGQHWHADATIDPRTEAFDIQLFYYPHDTPREMGGTMFLPGSHFRRVHESTIGRYQNFRGQVPAVCPAGTLIAAHHGIWHCGQANHTDRTRSMIKLRLNPTVRQRQLFDLSGCDAPEIGGILSRTQPWHGADGRLEILQRLRLWRSLTGSDYDVDRWLTRLEREPTVMAEVARERAVHAMA